eukprot:TRINITY_DN8476_c3_g2_i3.p1 TRINITY_DN8476_c3_g2~~TRINITY_DN8476_c3_g2_i3.p1  ORF type:complete len:700 (+),score=216.55 TRINITY_DN8476_c3_g2_i3:181-2280(+)
MMDLVELCILRKLGIEFLRVDGRTDTTARAACVEKFQAEQSKYKCMLLSTRVGGYGLNLTGADRVILLDPAWNPATDMQAVDRAYRIGQSREVRTYRLVMSGLIEDKMFRLQVFKMGLTRTALETRQQHRYFTAAEIRGLFEWTDPSRGETRKLLIEKHGEADDDAAERNARQDGSDRGWLKAGPAIGVSNFATIYTTLAAEEADAEDADGGAEVAEMRSRLRDAEGKAERAAEARSALEGALDGAQRGAEEAARAIAAAAEERAKASKELHAGQQELQEAKRGVAAATKLAEKMAQEKAAAQKRLASAEDQLGSARQATAAAEHEAIEASTSLANAERNIIAACADLEGQIAAFGRTAGSSVGAGDTVTAPAGALSAARRSVEKWRKACEAAATGHAASQEAHSETLRAEIRRTDADADVAIAEAGLDLGDACGVAEVLLPKAAAAAQKAAAKEQASLEKAAERAQERAGAAQEAAVQALGELREACSALGDALQGGSVAKAAGRVLQTSVRSLVASWQATKAAREARIKADLIRRKAARKEASAAAVHKEAHVRCAAAIAAQAQADAALGERESCRHARLAAVEAARAAAVAAEARETGHKRKRDEQRAAVGDARRSLKCTKVAEKEALSGRQNLYRHYAKVGDGAFKQDLEAARTSAEEQQKAISAVQALQEEEYDANQVNEAYEARRRQRPEAEV